MEQNKLNWVKLLTVSYNHGTDYVIKTNSKCQL